MNKRFIGVLTFAFIVALGASVVLYKVLQSRPQTAKAATASVSIAVAAHDLEVGALLKDDDIVLTEWSSALPAGATSKLEDLKGRGVITPIYAKEPLIDSRLAPKGAGGGLASMIPPGQRAVAVRVNEVVGVAGFVVPGMRVDVLISGNAPGGNNSAGTLTRTMLQYIEVLSAGQDFKKDNEGKPITVQVVTLLVTPEQAEQLSLASAQTSIQLILRNKLDSDMTKTPGTALANLFSGARGIALPRPAASSDAAPVRRPAQRTAPVAAPGHDVAPPAKKESFTMEIINGSAKTEKKFDNSGEAK
ncbi:MAG TPA: Flp pilus assembly protein CpaB [Candidatus Acidoferrales bacterium]|jgi:pilus assembly protein CpaB|nr:Flp pilus assembly protein CpaB [Candidatus Acidoferrales bacterium]